MSLLWTKTSAHDAPWADEPDDEDIHDGVETYSNMTVEHPDDTPYHDEELMGTTHLKENQVIDLHDPKLKAMQAWLNKGTLDHFRSDPHAISRSHEPIQVIHHEDTGEKYLLNGHHRAVVSREVGWPRWVRGEVHSVSDKRRGD